MQPLRQNKGAGADHLNSQIAHKLIQNYDHILGVAPSNSGDPADLFNQAVHLSRQAEGKLTDTFDH